MRWTNGIARPPWAAWRRTTSDLCRRLLSCTLERTGKTGKTGKMIERCRGATKLLENTRGMELEWVEHACDYKR